MFLGTNQKIYFYLSSSEIGDITLTNSDFELRTYNSTFTFSIIEELICSTTLPKGASQSSISSLMKRDI
jgi:hypothetical protein